jgi:hypothetical protein
MALKLNSEVKTYHKASLISSPSSLIPTLSMAPSFHHPFIYSSTASHCPRSVSSRVMCTQWILTIPCWLTLTSRPPLWPNTNYSYNC